MKSTKKSKGLKKLKKYQNLKKCKLFKLKSIENEMKILINLKCISIL